MSLVAGVLSGGYHRRLMLALHPHRSSNLATTVWPETNGYATIPVPRACPSAFHRSCVNTLISTIP
jgi:hypothetical protein